MIFPGYAEPTSPPLTVCDTGGSAGDSGTFTGVAAEKLADRLILTTQLEAGWYRYTIKWRFYLDGRIEPVMGFSAVNVGVHRLHAPAPRVLAIRLRHRRARQRRRHRRPELRDRPETGARPSPPVTLPTEAMRDNTGRRPELDRLRLGHGPRLHASSPEPRSRCPPTSSRSATPGSCVQGHRARRHRHRRPGLPDPDQRVRERRGPRQRRRDVVPRGRVPRGRRSRRLRHGRAHAGARSATGPRKSLLRNLSVRVA